MRWQWNTTKCDICKQTFKSSRSDSRYCSNTCRQRAHRRKQQMQREKRHALANIRFIENMAQMHPELRPDADEMLQEILAVTTAMVTHRAEGG